MVPLGPELRIHYNAAFLRSEVVRDGRNVGYQPRVSVLLLRFQGSRRADERLSA